jgi:hypothetical protein
LDDERSAVGGYPQIWPDPPELADQDRVVLEQLDLRIEQIKQGLAAKTAHDAG